MGDGKSGDNDYCVGIDSGDGVSVVYIWLGSGFLNVFDGYDEAGFQ